MSAAGQRLIVESLQEITPYPFSKGRRCVRHVPNLIFFLILIFDSVGFWHSCRPLDLSGAARQGRTVHDQVMPGMGRTERLPLAVQNILVDRRALGKVRSETRKEPFPAP
jgi:hypothetical protein